MCVCVCVCVCVSVSVRACLCASFSPWGKRGAAKGSRPRRKTRKKEATAEAEAEADGVLAPGAVTAVPCGAVGCLAPKRSLHSLRTKRGKGKEPLLRKGEKKRRRRED